MQINTYYIYIPTKLKKKNIEQQKQNHNSKKKFKYILKTPKMRNKIFV